MPERSPEERERARLEREAKRAAREGRSAPPPAAERSVPDDLPSPRYAGSEQIRGGDPPPATGRAWRREAGDPDADPPLVRRVPPGGARERIEAHDEPLPEPTPKEPPTRRIPPAPAFDPGDTAIGTKRVAAGHRFGRPHLPHRKPRATAAPGGPGAPGAGRMWIRRAGALLALAFVAFVLWFAASLFQPFGGDGHGRVVVTLPKGGLGGVADELSKQGVIGSTFFFKLRAKLEGKDGDLPAGRVVLKRDMSYGAVLDTLTGEKPAPAAPKLTKLTVPEGRSRDEIAATTKEAGIPGDYIKASAAHKGFDARRFGAPKGASLEGFLFPATYELKASGTADTLVAQQLKAFRRTIDQVDLKRARSKNLTVFDVISIASMIEREAGIAKDRPLIAAVIYNRLKQGMPLGIDATLRYELHNWTKPLKVSELQRDTPYNTRVNTGLPPGPIGNPGLAAIEAAAHPAKVDYLFYVVRPCGNGAHNFSSTDAEFQKDVEAYNRKRAELGGKSPVTCKE